jgi:hypothetical protein
MLINLRHKFSNSLTTGKTLSSRKFSLALASTPDALFRLKNPDPITTPKYVFVGGKGGVGKTSTSSALSISLSDEGLRTLIVSTDPAHSLGNSSSVLSSPIHIISGDALDLDLSSGSIVKIPTERNLWALEINVEQALEGFKANANNFNAAGLAKSFGVPPGRRLDFSTYSTSPTCSSC